MGTGQVNNVNRWLKLIQHPSSRAVPQQQTSSCSSPTRVFGSDIIYHNPDGIPEYDHNPDVRIQNRSSKYALKTTAASHSRHSQLDEHTVEAPTTVR